MKTPAVVLIDPKFTRNVAEALRSCALLGARTLWVTGTRTGAWDGRRRPRELRLERYSTRVDLMHGPLLLDYVEATPVAVELLPGAEDLRMFEHPEDPVYIFGPEDGTLSKDIRQRCHRFVHIPMDEEEDCLNLAHCVTAILLHRRMRLAGKEEEDASSGRWHPGRD